MDFLIQNAYVQFMLMISISVVYNDGVCNDGVYSGEVPILCRI